MPASAPEEPQDVHEDDNVVDIEEVDLDLDELDDQLRAESVGRASTIRVGGKIIHISHAGDWTSAAMQAAASGDWDAWAREVIEDPEEYRVWVGANLKNYQVEAVFSEVGQQANLSRGKSTRRAGSQRRSRKR